jgi:type II secretory pathway pseudopilin PulG
MQRFFSIIIIFGVLLVGGSILWIKKSDETARAERVEQLAQARRTFADKARSAVRSENDAYEREIRSGLTSYQEELKKRVYGRKPDAFDPGAYKKQVDEKFKKGEIKEAQQKSMLEGYEIVRGAYDTVMSGQWRSNLSAQAKEVRLDLYDVKRTKDDEGKPVLEGKFFFWGIEEGTRMSWGPLSIRYWKLEKEKVKEGKTFVEKDVEKVLGKVDGDSTPHVIMQNPSKYVPEFPSYVSIGTFWLPLMPREAVSADIDMNFVARTPGGDRDVVLKWEKFKIPDSWKLAEGESWDADVVEATEDEIAGKQEGQEAAPPQ